MSFLGALEAAAASLRGSLLRSVLATLGMAFGIAVVIAMTAVTQGSQARVQADLEALGTDLVMIRPGQPARSGLGAVTPARPLTLGDLDAVATSIPGIRLTAGLASKSTVASGVAASMTTTVVGTDGSYFLARRWTPASGRLFTAYEEQIGKAVCVLGATAGQRLLGRLATVGESIRIGAQSCEVIGVLPRRGGTSQASDDDGLVVMPLRAFQRRVLGKNDVHAIFVAARPGVTTERVRYQIGQFMAERRGTFRGAADVVVEDMAQTLTTARGTERTLSLLSVAVTVISLLVGGVGVMNVMLSSVHERRREIGIRLSIGATPRDIRLQFVSEAVMISLIGGVLGVILGCVLAVAAALLLKVPLLIEPLTVGLVLAFTAVVGVVFGYGPAARAALLDPVAALATS